MKKWIPIYGMFTKEANEIKDSGQGLLMVMYHGFVCFGSALYLIGYLILKP